MQTKDEIDFASDGETSKGSANVKRRRILEETRNVDADEDISSTEGSEVDRSIFIYPVENSVC